MIAMSDVLRRRAAARPTTSRSLFGMVLVAMLTLSVAQAQDHWELIHDEDGIKVYTQPVEGSSYLEFKGETIADVTLQQCAGFILSVPHMSKWMYGTKKAQILSAASEFDRVLYMINDAPFPLRDRDLVVHNVMAQQANNVVVYTIELMRDKQVESKYVHVKGLRARVTLTPISSEQTHIEYRAHVDPGGTVPAWAVNMFVLDTPLKTLQQAKKLVKGTKGFLMLSSIRNQP